MLDANLKEQILEALDKLSPEQQQRALQFVRSLNRPRGKPARSILKFAGRIAPDDVARMEKAIEDCEKVAHSH
jgi:hypothetical protein